MTSADISAVLPEILLAVYAMAALMFGVYTTKDKARRSSSGSPRA
jgi:NADH-quinone oxidoreductase subunit N